ncbi:head decoration protein [Thauera propionica]|uniref:head decoration protein n=1 Tax=Thauera propionica TaxID=2019431 RepID=UPI0023F3E2CB|nr:head decoration protein [Thauera propionica]MDD3676894.1 head decoration protein [Thauera propionica]
MSTPFVSPATLGDLVKREYDRGYTRETVTLKAGAAYPMGAVLGRITASGVYALSPAAPTTGLEGAEIACAVLLDDVPASTTDTQAVVLVRGPAIVAEGALVFDASVADDAAKAIKHQQLAAHGIVVRQVA